MNKYGYLLTKVGLIEIVVVAEQVVKVSFVNNRRFPESTNDIVVASCLQHGMATLFRTIFW